MAQLVKLPTHSDARGNLTVIENVLPFSVQRVYYLWGVSDKRGGHRHKETYQAFVCLSGSCTVYIDDGQQRESVVLASPDQLLLVPPEAWHTMENFSPGAVLLVLASKSYDPDDYIYERY